MTTPGGKQSVSVVNEPGLYTLVLRSRKPEAREFKRWVTHEVIPQIRKTGSYSVPSHDHQIPQTYSEALRLAADQYDEIERQHKLLEEQKPAVDFYKTVADSTTTISVEEAAKILNTGLARNNLYQFLREVGVLQNGHKDMKNLPYQEYLDRGWFRVIERPYIKDGEAKIGHTTRVYQKGLEGIARLLRKYGYEPKGEVVPS